MSLPPRLGRGLETLEMAQKCQNGPDSMALPGNVKLSDVLYANKLKYINSLRLTARTKSRQDRIVVPCDAARLRDRHGCIHVGIAYVSRVFSALPNILISNNLLLW